MEMEQIKELVGKMTLEEKACLCSGGDFWHTKAVERLGIPAVMVSDGPHGLRKQDQEADHLGVNESIKAVCFPTGCGVATSFNRELIGKMGQTLGNECQAENVSVILGPAVNIKRSPLCGRNFEYYSEDPYLASEIATAHINGVQSKHVGTSIKHFMANNQETRRMSVDAIIDERALHEIYLGAFEGTVRQAKPWTVMSSYNKVNGSYVGENKELLTDILRDEWGFDGFVVSDWGAVNDRIKALQAGLDLEMPASRGVRDAQIVKAVQNGTLEENVLDTTCERILNIVYRYMENRDENAVFDLESDHETAREVAHETIVLLKNEDEILPLKKGAKVVFIGKYAQKPRYQGGGSSHINSEKVTSALDAIAEAEITNVTFAKGFDDQIDAVDEVLEAEAVEAAAQAEVAVVFAGLPDAFESEGFDREHMRMPECQNHLIDEILKVQPNTIVVLHNGSPVEMPWVNEVKGIVEAYLGGEAVGGAVVDILFGDVNPSAKLAETFPYQLEDNPSYLSGFGSGDSVNYAESIFVGYRYYDKKNMPVMFPFGFGLSYTTFDYSNLKVDKKELSDQQTLTVSVDVTNTGKVAGKEIVELYVADKESTVIRPLKELKGFEKVLLQPGETKNVTMTLDWRAFAYYEPKMKDWNVETGEFEILIGKSSEEIVLTETVVVNGTKKLPVTYTVNTTFGDLPNTPQAMEILEPIFTAYNQSQTNSEDASSSAAEAITAEMNAAMEKFMPLRAVISFSDGKITPDQIEEAVDKLNKLS
ncbi:MAG: glycoside hydrolase family 3 C-terminal domain-containing protein [Lachnospiraceae bacterium]|nr:glycoside hydrolase family 3 C-terminal domain-containing protein [Lachnospiraceae bacterium]